MTKINFIINTKTVRALNPQKEIGQMGFPFTLNPIIGCPYGCNYCWSRMSLWKTPKEFFENVEVKVRGDNFKDWSVVSKMKERLELIDVPIINCGYNLLNNENWGYIK